MKKELNQLSEMLFLSQTFDKDGNCNWEHISLLLKALEDKHSEMEKRIACVSRMTTDVREVLNKHQKLENPLSPSDFACIESSINDIDNALDLSCDMCVVDNWYNLFMEPQVENVEYDFPEEVYSIGNAENTEIIADVYESDFVNLYDFGLLISETDEGFPSGLNKANYVIKDNSFSSIVIAKKIDLSKVPIVKKQQEENKKQVLEEVISKLKEIKVSEEEMLYILKNVGMEAEISFWEREKRKLA